MLIILIGKHCKPSRMTIIYHNCTEFLGKIRNGQPALGSLGHSIKSMKLLNPRITKAQRWWITRGFQMFLKKMHRMIKTIALPIKTIIVKSLQGNLKTTVRSGAIANRKIKAVFTKVKLQNLLRTKITTSMKNSDMQILCPSTEFVQSSIQSIILSLRLKAINKGHRAKCLFT